MSISNGLSLSHTHTHTHTHPAGLHWTSDQLLTETATCTTWTTHNEQETNIHALSWIQTCDPSHQAAADICLKPHDNFVFLVYLFPLCFLRPLCAAISTTLGDMSENLSLINWIEFYQDQMSDTFITEFCYVMSSRKLISSRSVLTQCTEWDVEQKLRTIARNNHNLQKHAYILFSQKFWWSDIDKPNITLIRDVTVTA